MKTLIFSLFLFFAPLSSFADFSFVFNDHTYEVVTTAETWPAAATDAASHSLNSQTGYLAKIDSAAENTAILNQLLENIHDIENTVPTDGGGQAALWIGATDSAVEGTWIWTVDGSAFWQGESDGAAVEGRYNNWGSLDEGEPNNYGEQNYGVIAISSWIFGSEGEWDDVAGSSALYYVVEFDTAGTGPIETVPAPPTLTLSTAGFQVTADWTPVSGATGYRLYYAPYPYLGEGELVIGSAEMGTATDYSIALPENAAFYVAVTARNNTGESSFSNIGCFDFNSTITGDSLHDCTVAYDCTTAGKFWYDNSCNSDPISNQDEDSDGFTPVQGDCDDTDVTIHPGAVEICGDGIDQDCDGSDSTCAAAMASTQAPDSAIRLVFIHHSTGGFWLADPNNDQQFGGLGRKLMENNYYVSATNYGWGPYSIGDTTDIPDWPQWFTGSDSREILAALYSENDQNFGDFGSWPRLSSNPGGENRIVMFKSCFPNSDLIGNPDDEAANEPDWQYSVSNAKAVYNELLTYFADHQDKLFVVITAPPQNENDYPEGSQPATERAANARAFNN